MKRNTGLPQAVLYFFLFKTFVKGFNWSMPDG